MKTEQDLLEEYQAKLEKLKVEKTIRATLPEAYQADALICQHGNHLSIKMWNDFRTTKTLSDALEVLARYPEIVTAEHWKDGFISCWPAEINGNAKKERATMDGSHEVEIEVKGGKGFGPIVEVQFWTRIEGHLVEISCPVSDCWKLVPQVYATYNNSGEVASCDIRWPSERSVFDSFRTFWSEKPGYSGSYYMAEAATFKSWAENQIAKKAAIV